MWICGGDDCFFDCNVLAAHVAAAKLERLVGGWRAQLLGVPILCHILASFELLWY